MLTLNLHRVGELGNKGGVKKKKRKKLQSTPDFDALHKQTKQEELASQVS